MRDVATLDASGSTPQAITAAAAAAVGVGECERRLWQLVASASPTTSTPDIASEIQQSNAKHQRHGSCSRRKSFAAVARLAEMMRDILAAPHFARPAEEDLWASAHLITFPSDSAWQDVCYKKMLERQRVRKMLQLEALEQKRMQLELLESSQNGDGKENGGAPDDGGDNSKNEQHEGENKMEEDPLGGAPPPAMHEWNIVPAKPMRAPFHAPEARRLAKAHRSGPAPVTWTIEDLANAGRLLHEPPQPVDFRDEQDMRRVYTLIYDVFRYKNILSQSLDDVTFFREHSNMAPLTSRVWLLLYDLYHRSFMKRTTVNAALASALFPSAGLVEVEQTLWEERVKLAAAIARIRIKNKALQLSQLLPHHLRDEKSGPRMEAPLTCWVNIKKVRSPEELASSISKTLNLHLIDEGTPLTDDAFKWDPHCPQFIIFHPSMRNKLVQSVLVRKNKLIIQDKAFCLGPATFVKIITDLQLTGSVIQSHVNSPRTTAYLASILGQNDNIKRLLAFSAGAKKTEYETYFNELGIKNILIFAEKMIDFPPDSNNFEEVIAVFATPPNSYSAVTDPIDLVCSRGGDLAMLEVLTETDDTPEGRKRVAKILDEQKQTLKFAMSRPQIQLVLYETHSEIDAENGQMVQRTVREINKHARIHHAVMQGKFKGLQPIKELQDDGVEEYLMTVASQQQLDDRRARALRDTIVPDSDLFDMSNLPDLCPNADDCLKLSENGCYLALVQRKQVTRMDNKYMIQMAENRGVFGPDPNSPKKPKPVQRKRVEDTTNQQTKAKRRFKEFEVDRLSTATKASMCHSKVAEQTPCPRADVAAAGGGGSGAKVSQSRRWWAETTRHITNLRASVFKQKMPAHALTPAPATVGTSSTPTNSKNKHNNNNNNASITNKNTPPVEKQQKNEENVHKFVTRLMSKGGNVDERVWHPPSPPNTTNSSGAVRKAKEPESKRPFREMPIYRNITRVPPEPVRTSVINYPPHTWETWDKYKL